MSQVADLLSSHKRLHLSMDDRFFTRYLDNRGLTALTEEMLSENNHLRLKTLSATNNHLSSLPDKMSEVLPKLDSLFLQDNMFEEFPWVALSPMVSLTLLNLSNNILSCFPASLDGGLLFLRVLVLNNNALTELPSLGSLHHLERLEVERNHLSALPTSLPHSLRVVRATHNALCTLPLAAFSGSMTELDVAHNIIETLPSPLLGASPLIHLDLTNNRLTELPSGVLVRLPDIVTLRAGRNPIHTLPGEIGFCLRLERLDLSDCLLHDLPEDLVLLASLAYLNLNRNDIIFLSNDILKMDVPIFLRDDQKSQRNKPAKDDLSMSAALTNWPRGLDDTI